jgi:hypothetical protein
MIDKQDLNLSMSNGISTLMTSPRVWWDLQNGGTEVLKAMGCSPVYKVAGEIGFGEDDYDHTKPRRK